MHDDTDAEMTVIQMILVVRMAAREQGNDALCTLLNAIAVMLAMDESELDGRSDRIQDALDAIPAKWKPGEDPTGWN